MESISIGFALRYCAGMQQRSNLSEDFTVLAMAAEQAVALLEKSKIASWRQYPAYANIAAVQSGATQQYYTVMRGNAAVAIANVRTKRLPILGGGIAMIAQGPTILDEANRNPECFAQIIYALSLELAAKKSLLLRFNLPVERDRIVHDAIWPSIQNLDGKHIHFSLLEDSAYETFIVDIRPEEADLRAKLAGKWRTDLRRGEKSEVEIVASQNPEDFKKFQPLLTQLAEDKGFSTPQDADFFAAVAHMAQSPEHLNILLAYHEGQVIGGHIGAYSGNMAVYLLGATNAIGRQLRASYLLQWAAIKQARHMGLAFYDLGGVNERENPDVFRFKKRMGGEYYRGPFVIEAAAGRFRPAVVLLAERAYQLLKK